MLIKTSGLVIRTLKYGETSIIFDLFTREVGTCSFIVGGVRKTGSKTPASLFQLMNWIDVVAYYKSSTSLNRIKECKSHLHYLDLPFSLQKRGVGMFMTEVIQKTFNESEANEDLYSFLWDTYRFLDETPKSTGNIHIIFLLRLSQFLGFYPHGRYSADTPHFNLYTGTYEEVPHPVYSLDPQISQLLSECLNHNIEESHKVTLNRSQRKDLIRDLLTFYKLHLDRLPEIQTHKILSDVLDG